MMAVRPASQPGRGAIWREDCNSSFDDAAVDQSLDATQAGRRRRVNVFRELLIRPRCIALEHVQDAPVDRVECDR